jgi:hypothetical protein
VLRRERQLRTLASKDAGVDEQPDLRRLRRREHVAVLHRALADLTARNQQNLVARPKRLGERSGLRVVAPANFDAPIGKRLRLLWMAHDDGDLLRGHLREQRFDDVDTEFSRGCCDDDHGLGSCSGASEAREKGT